MNSAKVIEVIVTDILRRGEGIEGDPIRIITQYWDSEGNLLVEDDPLTKERLEELITLKMKASNKDRIIEELNRKLSNIKGRK